jgi:hypothetical protein
VRLGYLAKEAQIRRYRQDRSQGHRPTPTGLMSYKVLFEFNAFG